MERQTTSWVVVGCRQQSRESALSAIHELQRDFTSKKTWAHPSSLGVRPFRLSPFDFRLRLARLRRGMRGAAPVPVTFFLLAQKEKSPKKKGAPARRRKPGQT